MTSLLDILLLSIRRSLSERRLWLYGIIIAIPSAAFATYIGYTSQSNSELQALIMKYPLWFFLFLCCQFLCLLIGKSALLLSLPKTPDSSTSPFRTVRFSAWLRAFIKALSIDLSLFGLFIGILALLSLPMLLSLVTQGSFSETLLFLAQLTLLPIVLIGYCIREFSYCYRLLSPLTLKSSFEAGINLLLRHKRQSFHFGLLFFGMTLLLFTFFLNLVMLSIVTVDQFLPAAPTLELLFAVMLFVIMWFEVLKQILWFEFFQSLARPKTTVSQEDSAQILKEEAEMPGV